jgi:hypothetical protein
MALGTAAKSIVQGMFGDVMPSARRSVRGMVDITGDTDLVPARTVKPEIMTGELGTSRILDMPEFQGVQQAERQANLDLAIQMMEEGADNLDIAARTGFGFFNGKPMMEIDDSKAKLVKPFTEVDMDKVYKAPEILKHDDFYKVYPEMKKLKVEFYDGDPPESKYEDNGYFDFENNTIGINKNAWFMGDKRVGARWYETVDEEVFSRIMKTMLHEAQHAVQQVEKLPGGASASDFMAGGSSGFNLTEDEAQKRYLKNISEMWARNVANRFNNPDDKTFNRNPFMTLGKDDESKAAGITARDAILPSGVKTNPFMTYDELKGRDPFPDTTEEPY